MRSTTLVELALGSLIVATTGCKSLPEEVPYQAQIMVEAHDEDRLKPLIGGDLLLDGEKVATIREGKHSFLATADWSGSKAKVRSVLAGTYALHLKGVCGEATVTAEGPNKVWRERSDSDLAEDVEKDGYVPIYVKPDLPEPTHFIVAWGEGEHVVEVGVQKLKAGQEEQSFSLAGCNKPPAVKIDGKEIGKLELKKKVHVISVDPNRCHQLQEVAYGKANKVAAPIRFDDQLGTLDQVPIWIFKSAPSTLKLGSKGAVVKELVAVPCRKKAAQE
jgi:hypothetical protein